MAERAGVVYDGPVVNSVIISSYHVIVPSETEAFRVALVPVHIVTSVTDGVGQAKFTEKSVFEPHVKDPQGFSGNVPPSCCITLKRTDPTAAVFGTVNG